MVLFGEYKFEISSFFMCSVGFFLKISQKTALYVCRGTWFCVHMMFLLLKETM